MKNMMIYADSIGETALVDGVIRFDLVRAIQVDKDKAKVETVATVAMSLPALLRAHQHLDNIVNRLIEQGTLKRTEVTPPDKEDF